MSNNVDNTNELPTLLSLCSGYGGIERGLELAGFKHRVIAHVEIEAFAIANLVSKMESGRLHPAPIWSNLKTLPLDCFRGRVDVLTGGYPCQPFSAAGQRKGKDDPRHLWPYIFEIIKAIKPFRCFFENVEGHISLGLREVISDLESLGYQTTWGIFSAREVGAPHQRKRVFIMADSERKGLEGQPRHGKYCDQSRWIGEKEKRPVIKGRLFKRKQHFWLPEPSVGRVVDGCADRVDRIRMLGNGVVPQTAAKAWLTLEKQLEKAGRGNEPGRLE
jgi:DNA (cytosine-5)-methyltransferase 1